MKWCLSNFEATENSREGFTWVSQNPRLSLYLLPNWTDAAKIKAYDSHCNIVLGEVEETIYVVDDEDDEDNVRTVKKQSEMLCVRGQPL